MVIFQAGTTKLIKINGYEIFCFKLQKLSRGFDFCLNKEMSVYDNLISTNKFYFEVLCIGQNVSIFF